MQRTPGARPPHIRPFGPVGRRLAAALAVPVLLFTAACGSDGSDDSQGSSDTATEVTGKVGEKPKVSVPEDAEAPDKAAVRTVTEGKGDKMAKGDFVRMDVFAQMTADDQELINTWKTEEDASAKEGAHTQLVIQLGEEQQMVPASVLNALVGERTGGRLLVEGTAKAIIGERLNPQAGIEESAGMVWVVDPVSAAKTDAKAEVSGEQADTGEGMPEVKPVKQKAAAITIPEGEKAPKELKQQVLIEGDGPEVKAGEGLIAQYTGVKWEDGEKFDSSWDHGGAIAFQIGTGSVVQGWDQGLVGKKVGDRVLLVIPPDLAYGNNPQSELAKNTLVFVVDIVGKV
ncbi:FKBP-type peptidyl-prolyl cis-trans isomerase [Streptomyces sp. TRM 70361]|uniref:FKBP-type peptidyl-prolyl cis-trans isomerase n=1 Tax=Streptomyces sp. TRM 70361 TaxID=3116553 RepID=UPI002E7BC49A|nr:FKBP-type peptidyl-prolyl cis-trans isomerase [Streptomyces sp. TRM 70361]MEE1939155.1 FKBP-type peptidyl-prolyl cis-trans isomerase [Streptomyces sp. TRM 70361]